MQPVFQEIYFEDLDGFKWWLRIGQKFICQLRNVAFLTGSWDLRFAKLAENWEMGWNFNWYLRNRREFHTSTVIPILFFPLKITTLLHFVWFISHFGTKKTKKFNTENWILVRKSYWKLNCSLLRKRECKFCHGRRTKKNWVSDGSRINDLRAHRFRTYLL